MVVERGAPYDTPICPITRDALSRSQSHLSHHPNLSEQPIAEWAERLGFLPIVMAIVARRALNAPTSEAPAALHAPVPTSGPQFPSDEAGDGPACKRPGHSGGDTPAKRRRVEENNNAENEGLDEEEDLGLDAAPEELASASRRSYTLVVGADRQRLEISAMTLAAVPGWAAQLRNCRENGMEGYDEATGELELVAADYLGVIAVANFAMTGTLAIPAVEGSVQRARALREFNLYFPPAERRRVEHTFLF